MSARSTADGNVDRVSHSLQEYGLVWVGQKRVEDVDRLAEVLRRARPGEAVDVEVFRKGQPMKFALRLRERPTDVAAEAESSAPRTTEAVEGNDRLPDESRGKPEGRK